MSIVELRVELPSYAHSFNVQVPTTSTIIDVKQEIFRTCSGGPKVDGQRLIWRGRFLKDDEKVDDIWKSSDESYTVHLAVHPSAWSKGPPSLQTSQSSGVKPTPTIPTPSTSSTHETTTTSLFNSTTSAPPIVSSAITGRPNPMQYVTMKHTKALDVLRGLPQLKSPPPPNEGVKQLALTTVEKHGYIWPTILDEEFPPQTPGGLIYDVKVIDGQQYLSLRQPAGTPTPAQSHALKVLTYTFSLLQLITNTEVPSTPAVTTLQGVSIPLHVNELLQQLGLGHLEVAGADALPVEVQQVHQRPNPAPVLPPVREIALRPLLAPLMFLVLRTTLLLYFVAPARKPFFAILVLLWMMYEIWRPIQNALMRIHRAAGDPRPQADAAAPQQPQPAADAPVGDAAGVQPAQPPNPDLGLGLGFGFQNLDEQLLNNMANQNISGEENALNAVDGPGTEEPGLAHKATTMLTLLITTLHPAVWNRRRAALRPREGRIRTEAGMRNTLPSENDEGSEARQNIRTELLAQHARRPRWMRNYIERVVAAEWVDDSD